MKTKWWLTMRMICRSEPTNRQTAAYGRRFKIPYAVFVIVICFCSNIFYANAQTNGGSVDTLRNNTVLSCGNINRILSFDIVLSSYAALPLLTEAVIYKNHNFNFRDIREKTVPGFSYDYDTYLQFAPFAATYILKVSGLHTRSTWSEIAVSNTLAMITGYGLTRLLKDNIEERRPEYAAFKSFPSGHTTIAFVGATVLSKEFKEDYPWIAVGGYTLAAVTGLSRIANNKHWMHDVLFGAGSGILFTEFSYSLTDILFNNRHSNKFNPSYDAFCNEKPNFVNIYLAYNHNFFENNQKLSNTSSYSIDNGVGLGIEGAYFFNKYIGVNARIKDDNYKVINRNIWWPEDSLLNIYSAEAGIILSYPLVHRVFTGLRAAVGMNHIDKNPIQDDVPIPQQNNWQYSLGVFANIWTEKHSFLRLYADYNHTSVTIEDKKHAYPTLSIGAAVGLHF